MTERPDSVSVADDATLTRAAYVHIPFCHRRCPYCDFAVVDLSRGPAATDRYVAALAAEIGLEPRWDPLDAVNFGGGTPSILAVHQLTTVMTALHNRFGFAPGTEISIEANPEDITPSRAADLVAAGFNRISLGVQSFDGGVLAALGRQHTTAQARSSVMAARRAGFRSVNLDLIFGSPGESLGSWEQTVEAALALEPDHLSGYALTVERGTALSRSVADGAPAPDPDDQADKYEILQAAAQAAGLVQYEVSNWARPGHGCRYNLGTWAQGEYVAFGVGAHGYRAGTRRRNVRRIDAYLARVESGERPEAGRETLTTTERDFERVFLGIRRAAGVVAGEAGRRLLESEAGSRLLTAGVIAVAGARLVVKRPLLTDAVARELLALSPRSAPDRRSAV
jgi:putative oxygen-independent coproporphyrinogen III oxidase